MKKIYQTQITTLDSLIPYPDNAKNHDPEQVALLAGRIIVEGFNQPIVVDKDMVIVKGHGRRLAAIKAGLKEVPVIVLDDLSPVEIKAARLADNIIAERSSYDNEKLSLEIEGLKEIDFDIKEIGFDDSTLHKMDLSSLSESGEATDSDSGDESNYTRKIETPIYEPTGEQPDVADLYETDKVGRILEKIELIEDMPETLTNFLRLAAYRHTVFKYDKIAEYYAHAPAEIQDLMEQSALVIIDFNRAVEDGYVRMSEELRGAYAEQK